MSEKRMARRDFLASVMASLPLAALDWGSFPQGKPGASPRENDFDAIIIGAGLGGLSCGAAFARQGFRPLVLEKHLKPGGYATTFQRPGGFVFDASLHSTTVSARNGVFDLIPGFPEIKGIEFVPHRTLYRAIFPEHDIRVPDRNLAGYIADLVSKFPAEKAGIEGLFADMEGLAADVAKVQAAAGKLDMTRFAQDYPFLAKSFGKTWGAMVDARLKDPKLKAIVSALWGYYGLPPSRLSPFYYALPTIGYLQGGGFYPVGKSQKMSDAFADFIESHGGRVMLRARVEKILVKDGAACGVRTADGREFTGRAVVSNANAPDTLGKMIDDRDLVKPSLARMEKLSIGLSTFQVFLGLKKDLVRELRVKDTEIFYNTGYDIEADYAAAVRGDFTNPGFAATLYDNLYKGYSPKGKNTLSVMTLQGFDHWAKYEADYFAGKKEAYRAEKLRMADILIDQAERILLPGLRKAIEVRDAATPLTNLRYTANPRGAIYGWDQTLDNAGQARFPSRTPVKNLYLAGAWTFPGGGYMACIPSGLLAFAEVMRSWQK
ncbi:MAG TPA: NAD(P)/FAD-dependent oxidoreductase [Terriglobales bacterium]|nr:NAD(P)/FAD-dependent oxidoreductase [Terriglobales bacterium]